MQSRVEKQAFQVVIVTRHKALLDLLQSRVEKQAFQAILYPTPLTPTMQNVLLQSRVEKQAFQEAFQLNE